MVGRALKFAQWRNPRNTRFDVLQSEIDDLRTFLSDGDVAIDIGAQVGDATLPMAFACGPNGMVFAFEPNPFVFFVLARNAVLNPVKCNIIAYSYAVTAKDGPMVVKYGGPDYQNGGENAAIL